MQIIDLRAEGGGNGQYFGRNRKLRVPKPWRRARADARAPRAIVATAARRSAPSSPICELWRGARGGADRIHSWAARYSIHRRALNFGAAGGRSSLRAVALSRLRSRGEHHRARFASSGAADESAIVLRPVARIVLAPVTECHPSSPQRCPQTHRRWLRAQRASMRLLCAAAPRGLLAHCATDRGLHILAEHTKLNKERGAIFQQRCSGRIVPHHRSNHGAVTAVTSRREPVQEFWMFVRAIAV